MKHRGPCAFRRVVRRLHRSLPKITRNRYWNASIFAIRISKNAHLVFREPPWNDIFGTLKCCISLGNALYLALRSARNRQKRPRSAPRPPKDPLWAPKSIVMTALGRPRGPRHPPSNPQVTPLGSQLASRALLGPPNTLPRRPRSHPGIPRALQSPHKHAQLLKIQEKTMVF